MKSTVDATFAQPNIAIVQPRIMSGMVGAYPMIARPIMPTTMPPMMKGLRRPSRLRVRSLQMPTSGDVMMNTVCAMPVA